MRAGITQRKRASLRIAANDQWLFQQHRRPQFAALHSVARERAIPKPKQHQRIGRLLCKWRFFGHQRNEEMEQRRKSKPSEKLRAVEIGSELNAADAIPARSCGYRLKHARELAGVRQVELAYRDRKRRDQVVGIRSAQPRLVDVRQEKSAQSRRRDLPFDDRRRKGRLPAGSPSNSARHSYLRLQTRGPPTGNRGLAERTFGLKLPLIDWPNSRRSNSRNRSSTSSTSTASAKASRLLLQILMSQFVITPPDRLREMPPARDEERAIQKKLAHARRRPYKKRLPEPVHFASAGAVRTVSIASFDTATRGKPDEENEWHPPPPKSCRNSRT